MSSEDGSSHVAVRSLLPICMSWISYADTGRELKRVVILHRQDTFILYAHWVTQSLFAMAVWLQLLHQVRHR